MFAGIIRFLTACLAGVGIGLWSGVAAIGMNGFVFENGWQTRLIVPTANDLAYAVAANWQENSLPTDSRSMFAVVARQDRDGNALSSACNFMLQGSLPDARWWSLEIEGHPALSLGAGDILPDMNGFFHIRLGRDGFAARGLNRPGDGHFGVILRFHGPKGSLRYKPLEAALPVIRLEDCP